MVRSSILRKLEQIEHVWKKIKQITFTKKNKKKLGPIYESSVYRALRKSTYEVVGDQAYYSST